MALGLPDDPKQQQRLLIGMIPLILLFGYWYFLHDGFVQEVETMETRLESLEASNSQARMLAPQSRRLEERLQELERHIGRLEELVPRGEEVSRLLNTISERADQIGVDLARFNPGATDRGPHYNRRTFQMTVLGQYHEIARFLTEIGSLNRIITPINLSVVPGGTRQGERMLEATFLIETYVLPDQAQQAAANQGGNTGA
ncbi:MAG: type 4a pilus biogenesis protein PilO [Longimicrobiales bacterium]|nr:type 4a pilus biogenesis protein PilO [Longimicrobiales bacterium]